jgi:hypothetical protein
VNNLVKLNSHILFINIYAIQYSQIENRSYCNPKSFARAGVAAWPLNGVVTFNFSIGKKSYIEALPTNEMRFFDCAMDKLHDDQSELLQLVP